MATPKSKQYYYQLEDEKSKALTEAEKIVHRASDSTLKGLIRVKGKTIYLKGLADLHIPSINMDKFDRELREDALIDDLYLVVNGDQGNCATALAGSSNVNESITNPEQENDILINSFRKAGPALIEKIACITDGNHDLRVKALTSVRLGKRLALALGIEEVYAENIVILKFVFEHPETKQDMVFNVLVRHGENTSANTGKKSDQNLSSPLTKNFDLIIDGHTHKILYSSTRVNTPIIGNKPSKEKEIHTANFGSPQRTAPYGERAGYGPIAPTDGELLRVNLVKNLNGEYVFAVDFINRRDIIKQQAEEMLEALEKEISKIETKDYKKINELISDYKDLTPLAGDMLADVDIADILKQKFSGNKDMTPTELRLMIWSGMLIGDSSIKNEEQIDNALQVAEKLNGSCKIILNGDLIKDDDQGKISKNADASKTFSYIQVLAEKMLKLKEHIIGFNYGIQETGIMRNQAEELAKLALINLQMEEKLVYEPYNKTELLTEKKRLQAKQVNKYNKSILSKQYSKYLHDEEKWPALEEFINTGLSEEQKADLLLELNANVDDKSSNSKNASNKKMYKEMMKVQDAHFAKKANVKKPDLDDDDESVQESYIKVDYDNLEKLLVVKLRMEDKLLSLQKHKQLIDAKFPLSKTELRKPRKDLIANIFFQFLGKDPKEVVINTKINTDSLITTKIKKEGGRTFPVNIIGGYSSSIAGRGAQQNKLAYKENSQSGADIYYISAKSGKEYMSKNRTSILNEFGEVDTIKDNYFISTGRFDDSHERIERENPSNRIYTLKVADTAKEDLKENQSGRNMYVGSLQKNMLTCSSVSYETALFDQDITKNIIVKCIENSADKMLEEFLERKKQQQKETAIKTIISNIKQQHKTKLNEKKAEM